MKIASSVKVVKTVDEARIYLCGSEEHADLAKYAGNLGGKKREGHYAFSRRDAKHVEDLARSLYETVEVATMI